jgi:conjugal transfer pilus assembly protein TraB
MIKTIIAAIKGAFGFKKQYRVDALNKLETGDDASEVVIDNNKIRSNQNKIIILVVALILAIVFVLAFIVQKKTQTKKIVIEPVNLQVETADKALDGELHWRNYFEEQRASDRKEFASRLVELEEQQKSILSQTTNQVESELAVLKQKLVMAQRELSDAGLALNRVSKEEQERLMSAPVHIEPNLGINNFDTEVEFDRPKSTKNYIPEGTYFTGHLLGGIVVSTALNTADENATPVTIRLTGGGNLAKANKLEISKCRMMGSAYGDLSSERAVVRLEKLICEENGAYVTSKIAGVLYGPDGFNGLKGTVVSTSSKHIKNAAIGGLISGLSQSSKGQEGLSLGGGGLLSTKNKDFKDLATGGLTQGVSNAGDKLADYYLRQAESMSPVLTVPGGVRIQAHIIKGFFVGEIGTHQRIKTDRAKVATSEY